MFFWLRVTRVHQFVVLFNGFSLYYEHLCGNTAFHEESCFGDAGPGLRGYVKSL
jgi:hypothetical protein